MRRGGGDKAGGSPVEHDGVLAPPPSEDLRVAEISTGTRAGAQAEETQQRHHFVRQTPQLEAHVSRHVSGRGAHRVHVIGGGGGGWGGGADGRDSCQAARIELLAQMQREVREVECLHLELTLP